MQVSLQPGYIIHRRSYRDTSWLLEVLTAEYGLIGLVAKGVRRQNNDKRALLQPFTKLAVSFSGRGELMTLTAAELLDASPGIRGQVLYSGMYINELLLRLLHRNDPHESVFRAYEQAVALLSTNPAQTEPILRRFELRLLMELGYGLQLQYDALNGEPIAAERSYRYNYEEGPVPVESGATNGPVVSGRCLLGLAYEDFDQQDLLAEMKVLMRYVIHHQLGGKPLKSRELFAPAVK